MGGSPFPISIEFSSLTPVETGWTLESDYGVPQAQPSGSPSPSGSAKCSASGTQGSPQPPI